MKSPNLHKFLEGFSLQPSDAAGKTCLPEARVSWNPLPVSQPLSCPLCIPTSTIALGRKSAKCPHAKASRGYEVVIFTRTFAFSISQTAFHHSKEALVKLQVSEVLQGKSLWILHVEYQLPGMAIDCAYACFGFEEHPIYTWHTILPPASWLGCLFSQPEHKLLEAGNAPYLALPAPRHPAWAIACTGCAGTWWVYELKVRYHSL